MLDILNIISLILSVASCILNLIVIVMLIKSFRKDKNER